MTLITEQTILRALERKWAFLAGELNRSAPASVCMLALFNDERNGRGDWIRTNDPLLPKQVRYQTALRPELWCENAGLRGKCSQQ